MVLELRIRYLHFPVMDYFEIFFAAQMVLCRKAAEKLHLKFPLGYQWAGYFIGWKKRAFQPLFWAVFCGFCGKIKAAIVLFDGFAE